jgi:hypothetical protein
MKLLDFFIGYGVRRCLGCNLVPDFLAGFSCDSDVAILLSLLEGGRPRGEVMFVSKRSVHIGDKERDGGGSNADAYFGL